MGRQADERLGAHEGPRLVGRGVALADVDAVGACSRGQVGPIVHDERDVVGVTDVSHQPGPRHDRLVVEVLVAELHDVDAAADAGVDERLEIGTVGSAEVEPAPGE